MSSNHIDGSPSRSPDPSHRSGLHVVVFTFAGLSSLFMALWLVRWLLRRTGMRHASFRLNCSIAGLDPTDIATLTAFPYIRKQGDESSVECPICLSAVEEGEMVKCLPDCKHSFHSDCIDLWLRRHTTCPVCRVQVPGSRTRCIVRQPNRVQVAAVLDLERQT